MSDFAHPDVQSATVSDRALVAAKIPEPVVIEDSTQFVLVINSDRIKTSTVAAIWTVRAIDQMRNPRREILMRAEIRSVLATQAQMLSILTEAILFCEEVAVSADPSGYAMLPMIAIVGPTLAPRGMLAELIIGVSRPVVHGKR
jgi:hypothetical protein